MGDLLKLCKKYFGKKDLYEVFDIPKDASEKESKIHLDSSLLIIRLTSAWMNALIIDLYSSSSLSQIVVESSPRSSSRRWESRGYWKIQSR